MTKKTLVTKLFIGTLHIFLNTLQKQKKYQKKLTTLNRKKITRLKGEMLNAEELERTKTIMENMILKTGKDITLTYKKQDATFLN